MFDSKSRECTLLGTPLGRRLQLLGGTNFGGGTFDVFSAVVWKLKRREPLRAGAKVSGVKVSDSFLLGPFTVDSFLQLEVEFCLIGFISITLVHGTKEEVDWEAFFSITDCLLLAFLDANLHPNLNPKMEE